MDEAIRFCSILPELFGKDLDRKTLWERIGNALSSSAQTCGGDWELLIAKTLEFIKADKGQAAANQNIYNLIELFGSRPKEWQDRFIHICEMKAIIITVKARQIWNENKRSAV
jgi:hypothetical protein